MKKIQRKVRRKLSSIANALDAICKGFDSDAIHSMRVSYKQLRSLLRVAGGYGKLNKSSTFRQLKLVYSAAGTVRDWELFTESLMDYFTPAAGDVWLELRSDHKLHLETELKLAIADVKISKLKAVVTRSFRKNTGRSAFREFVSQQTRAIGKNLNEPLTDTVIHDIRKHYKNILYTLPFLKKKGRNKAWRDAKSAVSVTAARLGDYIDTSMKLNQLKKEMENDPDPEVMAALVKAQIDWLLLKHRQKDKLIRKLSKNANFRLAIARSH